MGQRVTSASGLRIILLAAVVVFGFALLAFAPAQAQAKVFSRDGWYEGSGSLTGEYQTISKIYIKKNRLYVVGKLYHWEKTGRWKERVATLKRAKRVFRLSSHCKYGHSENTKFFGVSRKRYKRQLDAAGKMIPLGVWIHVKGGAPGGVDVIVDMICG